MNIHALRSFFFSSKRPDYPYLAVTQAPTPKNPLVAASSKRCTALGLAVQTP